ncbi:MAG: 5'-nucleotidase C-terminal domain-containing protein [Delftia lacustris]|uniref:5'-nucleotidase C-terminal domain-containing protein n=1 Tax=Delftia lacustris TaxID=558537 RepID=UPI002F3E3ABB
MHGKALALIGDSFTIAGKAATDAQKTALKASAAATGVLRVTTPGQATAALPFKDKVAQFNLKQVATVLQELRLRRARRRRHHELQPVQRRLQCRRQRQRGGDIQQLVAQAYLEEANRHYGGADITLQSGGGVRISLLGQTTAAQVIQVLPFGNKLFRLDITGTEVKGMLEDGLQAARPQRHDRPLPHRAACALT